jgi:hypothetical protein
MMIASDVPIVRHRKQREGLIQNRHDDRAAADAEKARENAGHAAREQKRYGKRNELIGREGSGHVKTKTGALAPV